MSYLKWKRLCKTCGVRYAEVDNMGVHACKFHCGPLNRYGPGKWWPEGCWDCCGKSPYATLPSGRRNPRFSAKFLHGCTGMDHSALQTSFTPSDNIPEKVWPRELCEALNDDIMNLKGGNINIKHKGLRINDIGEFFIERFDTNMYYERRKHKWDGDKKLTIEIKYFINDDEAEKSVVLDRDATVADLLDKVGAKNLYRKPYEVGEDRIFDIIKIDTLNQSDIYKVI